MDNTAPISGDARTIQAKPLLERRPEISTTQGMHTADFISVEDENVNARAHPTLRLDQTIGVKRARDLRSHIEDRGFAPPVGPLHQQLARARPTRIGLIELRKIEHEIAGLSQGRKRAAIVQMKGGWESAGPLHENRLSVRSHQRSGRRLYASP